MATAFLLSGLRPATYREAGQPSAAAAQVVQDTYRSLRELGLDESCWLWPSITQNAYQTAEILAALLYVGRNRVSHPRWGITRAQQR